MNTPQVRETAVPGTVSLRDAAATRWQVVVVGAGPAGTATARRLADSGWLVLLLDRAAFPRGKVCGCCLSPLAIAELRRLRDAETTIPALGLSTVRLASDGRVARIALPAGMVVSRETLDAHLLRRAIVAGCSWLPETRVVAIDEHRTAGSSTVIVSAADGAEHHAIETLMVVVATGLGDGVRGRGGRADEVAGSMVDPSSRVGIGTSLGESVSALPSGELVMAVAKAGYCGLVRLADGRLDVAAAVDRRALAAGPPAGVVAGILTAALGRDHEATVAAALASATFRATPPLTRRCPTLTSACGRIVRVGDAAGYVEPFTGEGIGWALASARLFAEALGAPREGRDGPAAAHAYAAAHARVIGPFQRRCRQVAAAVRRPRVVAATVMAARALPGCARAIVPLLVGARDNGDPS